MYEALADVFKTMLEYLPTEIRVAVITLLLSLAAYRFILVERKSSKDIEQFKDYYQDRHVLTITNSKIDAEELDRLRKMVDEERRARFSAEDESNKLKLKVASLEWELINAQNELKTEQKINTILGDSNV